MLISDRLRQLGIILPQPARIPPEVILPFSWVHVRGDRAWISGHGPTESDGSFAKPLGKVGHEVNRDEAYRAARLTGLAILSSLERELGNLDRIAAWGRVFGMVNCAPDFRDMPSVINGFSDLILEVFGAERGQHARSAVGVASLPFNIPVEIEAEVVLGSNA